MGEVLRNTCLYDHAFQSYIAHFEIAFYQLQGVAGLVNKSDMGCAAAESFDAASAGAAKQVKELGIPYPFPQDVEQVFAHPVRCGPYGTVFWREEASTAQGTGNYPHGWSIPCQEKRNVLRQLVVSSVRGILAILVHGPHILHFKKCQPHHQDRVRRFLELADLHAMTCHGTMKLVCAGFVMDLTGGMILMSIKEQIQKGIIEATKSRDHARLDTLRMAKGALLNKEKEKARTEGISDEEAVAVLRSEIRKRQQSMETYEQLAKTEQVEALKLEISVIESFLPQQLSEEDIEARVRTYLAEHPDMNHAGKLTGAMKKELGDAADGKVLNEVCRRVLGA